MILGNLRGLIALTAVGGLLIGCAGGARVAKANDALRAKNASLERQVNELARRNKELEAQLQLAARPPSTLPEEILANAPQVTEITIGRLSHARDNDGDGRTDTLLLYLHPADGRGRFVQLVGTVSVHAVLLPGDADATTIGRVVFTPIQVRDAYRSTITGIHYAFDVPIQLPQSEGTLAVGQAAVRAVYADGLTNRTLSADRTIKLE
jgi:hypothetical protein